jgi:small subunit ribosomal protein S4
MGDIKKIRKKYETPKHPWNRERIEIEGELKKQYGLKNKKEIWKMDSKLRNFKDQVKSLSTRTDAQGNKEKLLLTAKLIRLGLLKESEPIDKVLSLEVKDILERRLQTLLHKKLLARSVGQARQFIVHGHIRVNESKITAPGYIVKASEENAIQFSATSALYDKDHPERFKEEEKAVKKQMEKEKELGDKKEKLMTDEELEAKRIADALSQEETKRADAEVQKLIKGKENGK